jgi:anti-sigma regulatory factor (Ser/Thr protein kinase)
MGQLRNALRAFATDVLDPAMVVHRLNRFAFEQGPTEMATLCYATFDPHRGELAWTLAGHPPPLVVPPGAEPVFLAARPAPPIGADPRGRFRTATTVLATGTTLLLYTDGLVERRGESLDIGLERLAHRARLAPALLDAACDDVIDHLLGVMPPSDDVALLGLRYVGAQRGPIRIRRPARATELAPVRRVISAWLEATGMAPDEIGVVSVAVSEAATNAIEHAYGPGEGWFEVEAEIEDDELRVAVRDEGRWRPKARGGGGRGLGLISRLMDEFEVRRSQHGTEIRMRRVLREVVGKDS